MKKIVSLILSLAICFSLMPTALAADAASKFTDVPVDAWYREELNFALERGYISGTSETTFAPDDAVTRGQFVTILGRMVGASAIDSSTKFTDVNTSSYYAPYVSWAALHHYVAGASSTAFLPDADITIEQMGCILSRYIYGFTIDMRIRNDDIAARDLRGEFAATKAVDEAGITFNGIFDDEGIDNFIAFWTEYKSRYTEYTDASLISDWAATGMGTMWLYDFLPTDANGNVHPQKVATRAEAVVALVRLAKGVGFVDRKTVQDSLIAGKVSYESLDLGDKRLIVSKDAFSSAINVHDGLRMAGLITDDMTEYDKADVYVYWLRKHTVYDVNAQNDWLSGKRNMSDSFTANGALIERLAVCQGYTAAYNTLLWLEGIECSTDSTSSHIWTVATLDGKICNIDATNGVFDAPRDVCACDPEAIAEWLGLGQ